MAPTWETAADPSQHSIDEEQAAARAIEALETDLNILENHDTLADELREVVCENDVNKVEG